MKAISLAIGTVLLLGTGTTMAQDIAAGERSWNKCRACHQIGDGARNLVGPQLNGLFGRPAGSAEGYSYSNANKSSGIVWNEEVFAEFIKDPRAPSRYQDGLRRTA